MVTLLDAGADLHTQNNEGNTALHGAASNGYTDTAVSFLERGADPYIQSKTGKTPIQVAKDWPEIDRLEFNVYIFYILNNLIMLHAVP